MDVIKVSDVSLESLLHFYSQNGEKDYNWYEKKLSQDYFDSKLIGSCAGQDGVIQGVYLVVKQNIECFKNVNSVQSIDTLISKNARGGRLIKKLFDHTVMQLQTIGVEIVYGIPNERFGQVAYKLLGWECLGTTYRLQLMIPIKILKLLLFPFLVKKIGAVFVDRYPFCDIGKVEGGDKLLYVLKYISVRSDAKWLRTYCSEASLTFKLLHKVCLKKKSLDFAIYKVNRDFVVPSDFSVEYIDYDGFYL